MARSTSTVAGFAGSKLPLPFPNSIETVSEFTLVTARSCTVSPLKSPIATEVGVDPTSTVAGFAGSNLPLPFPNSIDTSLESSLAITKSKSIGGVGGLD